MNFKLKLKEIDFPVRMNFDVAIVKLEDGQVFLRLKIEEIRVV